MENGKIPNYRKAEILEKNYMNWKKSSLQFSGYFPIFSEFKEGYYLKNLSGNAVKLYLYLGLRTGNEDGKTWVSIETMASYFGKSKRTISDWLKELEKYNLVERMQMSPNDVSYTFLLPYGLDISRSENQ